MKKNEAVSPMGVAQIVSRALGLFFIVQLVPEFRRLYVAYYLWKDFRAGEIEYRYGFELDLFYPILLQSALFAIIAIYLLFFGEAFRRFLIGGLWKTVAQPGEGDNSE